MVLDRGRVAEPAVMTSCWPPAAPTPGWSSASAFPARLRLDLDEVLWTSGSASRRSAPARVLIVAALVVDRVVGDRSRTTTFAAGNSFVVGSISVLARCAGELTGAASSRAQVGNAEASEAPSGRETKTKDHGSSVKDDKRRGLRKKGTSKSRAARIANAPDSSGKGGKASGSGKKRDTKSQGGTKAGRRPPAARAPRRETDETSLQEPGARC
jgi:hypothetical protein